MGRVRVRHERLPVLVRHLPRLQPWHIIIIIIVGLLLHVDEAAVPAVAREDVGVVVDTLAILGMVFRTTTPTTTTTLKVPAPVVVHILLLLLSMGMIHAGVRLIRVDHRPDQCRMVHPTRRSLGIDVTHLRGIPLVLAARSWELPLGHAAAVAAIQVVAVAAI